MDGGLRGDTCTGLDAMDSFNRRWPEPFRLVQNRGTGMLIQGARDWRDYQG